MEAPLINITSQAIVDSKSAILEILNARADQKTIRSALSAFAAASAASATSIRDCVLSGDKVENHTHVDLGGLSEAIRELKSPETRRKR